MRHVALERKPYSAIAYRRKLYRSIKTAAALLAGIPHQSLAQVPNAYYGHLEP